MSTIVSSLLLGLVAGVVRSMFGIDGGLIMMPGMILILAFGQREALGTSLMAQLLPVGLLAVAEYWRRGEVNVRAALVIGVGLFVGAWLGARLVGLIPKEPMKQAYGIFLIVVGLYFLLAPGTPAPRRSAPLEVTGQTVLPGSQAHSGK